MQNSVAFASKVDVNGNYVLRVRASLPYRAVRKILPGLVQRAVNQPVKRKNLLFGSCMAPPTQTEPAASPNALPETWRR